MTETLREIALRMLKENYVPPTPEEAEWLIAQVEYNSWKRLMSAHMSTPANDRWACNYPDKPALVVKHWDRLIKEVEEK